jgi:uncharacterized membrane protein
MVTESWAVTTGALTFLVRAEQGGRAIYAAAWTVVGVGLLVAAIREASRDPLG